MQGDTYLRPGYPPPNTVPLHGNSDGAGAMRMNARGAERDAVEYVGPGAKSGTYSVHYASGRVCIFTQRELDSMGI